MQICLSKSSDLPQHRDPLQPIRALLLRLMAVSGAVDPAVPRGAAGKCDFKGSDTCSSFSDKALQINTPPGLFDGGVMIDSTQFSEDGNMRRHEVCEFVILEGISVCDACFLIADSGVPRASVSCATKIVFDMRDLVIGRL